MIQYERMSFLYKDREVSKKSLTILILTLIPLISQGRRQTV